MKLKADLSYKLFIVLAIMLVPMAYVSTRALAAVSSVSANESPGSVAVGYNSTACSGGIAGAVRFNSAGGGTSPTLSPTLSASLTLLEGANIPQNLTALGGGDYFLITGRGAGGGQDYYYQFKNVTPQLFSTPSYSGFDFTDNEGTNAITLTGTDGKNAPTTFSVSTQYGGYLAASAYYQFTVAASTKKRTLLYYFQTAYGTYDIDLSLSDGSVGSVNIAEASATGSGSWNKLAVTYAANSAAQTLTVKINVSAPGFNGVYGWVSDEDTESGSLDTCNGTNWLPHILPNDSVLTSCVAANTGVLRYLSGGAITSGTYSNYVQVCNGTSWVSVGSEVVAGSDGQIQYNKSGVMAADSNLTFDRTTNKLNAPSYAYDYSNSAMKLSTSGNPIIGQTSLSTTRSPLSVAIGLDALRNPNGEAYSVAVGHQALRGTTSGLRNTAVGYQALYSNTSGSDNTAIGYKALYNNTTGNENTALGSNAMLGSAAITGSYNTAVGSSALAAISSGSYNTAVGRRALYANTTGSYNSAMGSNALAANITGSNNTAAGYGALQLASANNNTALGYLAGANITTGSNNIMIGANTNAPSATADNQLNIGNLIYGDIANGNLAIGTSTFSGKFMVAPPTAETIAAAATITVNACGTIKQITSAGAVTTNTTNTFTAPAAANKGCCMDVINTGANNIVLDRNALFVTSGGADLTLTPDDAVRVCSNGSTWYQMMPVSANN